MKKNDIHILWDSSHLWGLMAWRALRMMGASPKLVLAQKITQGWLLRKQPDILLVPGGSARQKALALGKKGLLAIRDWVGQGGIYLGFCGGAGLALRQKKPLAGLGLCPWQRKSYPERLYHLISGPLQANVEGKLLELPVWWPGRFEEDSTEAVEILARFVAPARELWLADLPFMEAPPGILSQWRSEAGLDAALSFAPGQPLIVSGQSGAGKYVLSYVHLETPASPDANTYLAQLLAKLAGMRLGCEVSPWIMRSGSMDNTWGREIEEALAAMDAILLLGEKLGFFFRRMPWLWGWRRDAPGMACNNLLACLKALAQMPPQKSAKCYWHRNRKEFARLMGEFAAQGQDWLWHWRMAQTLGTWQYKRENLEKKRNQIFGHAMFGGGIVGNLLNILEKLIYLCQNDENLAIN